MKKRAMPSWLPFIIGSLLLPLGCGDSTGPAFATIDVSPTTATLTAIGETVRFTAVSRDSEGNVTGAGIAWSSSHPQVASVDEFSGLATASVKRHRHHPRCHPGVYWLRDRGVRGVRYVDRHFHPRWPASLKSATRSKPCGAVVYP